MRAPFLLALSPLCGFFKFALSTENTPGDLPKLFPRDFGSFQREMNR